MIIEDGNIVRIVGGTKALPQLEPIVYLLCWEKRSGHFLVKQPEIQSAEKIFGPMAGKDKKVLKTFERRNGNTGVILSGEKGLGKSLFCRHLMLNCLDSYIPVVIVRDLIPGTANFIQSIGQPCMFVFDEFLSKSSFVA